MTPVALRRTFRRRQHLLAALCAVLALSVVAHHALPEAMPAMSSMSSMGHTGSGGHHDKSAVEMCLAIAGIGGLLLLATFARWRAPVLQRTLSTSSARFLLRPVSAAPRARAGPLRSVVLRL